MKKTFFNINQSLPPQDKKKSVAESSNMACSPQKQPHDEIFNLFSPYILPPKFNSSNTGNPLPYNMLSTDMRIIQTPYSNATLRFNTNYIDQIQQDLKSISNKIVWEKTPQKGQDIESSQEELLSESQQQQLVEEENFQKESSMNEQQSDQQEKKQSNSHQIQPKKRPYKVHATPKQIPEPINTNKQVVCNCKKTKCLKLYCDCFRINQTCEGCNCVGCHNLEQYAEERNNAILVLMDRNPDPFSQKIEDDKHLKGCNCKKSNCLKKYCECYQAGLKCGQNCKCEECKNCEIDFERRKKQDFGEKNCEKVAEKQREGTEKINQLTVKKQKIMREM